MVVVWGDYQERTSTFSIFSREYVHSTPVSLHKSLIGLIVTLHGLNEQTLRLRLTTSEPRQTARHVGPHHPPLYLHQLQCQSEDDFHRPRSHLTRQDWTGGELWTLHWINWRTLQSVLGFSLTGSPAIRTPSLTTASSPWPTATSWPATWRCPVIIRKGYTVGSLLKF